MTERNVHKIMKKKENDRKNRNITIQKEGERKTKKENDRKNKK